MVWDSQYYAGESIAAKKEKIKWKILHRAGLIDVYVIALSSNPKNLLDIIPSWELNQKCYPKEGMVVVGIDKGYENAMELAGRIVMDVYRDTGGFNVRDYFKGRQKDNKNRPQPFSRFRAR